MKPFGRTRAFESTEEELSRAVSMGPGPTAGDGGLPNFQYPLVAFEFIGVASAAPHQGSDEFRRLTQLLAGCAGSRKRTCHRMQYTVLCV